MRSALVLAAAGTVLGMEIHAPAYAAGVYAETRAGVSPHGYRITGIVSVVEACPCDWTNTSHGSGSYEGLILAFVDDACTECSVASAACAAKQASALGLLLSDGFGHGVSETASVVVSCEEAPLPTAFLSLSTAAVLLNASHGGGIINVTMADPDDDGFDCGAAWINMGAPGQSRSALHHPGLQGLTLRPTLGLALQAPGYANAHGTSSPAHAPTRGWGVAVRPGRRRLLCGRPPYTGGALHHVPFVYLGFLPVWLVATLLWAWNNVRHSRHVRELPRRFSLLPLLGLVQAGLSVPTPPP